MMKVAVLAPIARRVSPREDGSWEQVVSLLTEGLVAQGIEVTLFASADSLTSARLVSVCPRPYTEDSSLDATVWACLHSASLFERADSFDIIHNLFDFLPLSYSALVKTPVVTTIHEPISADTLPIYQRYNQHGYYVSISDAERHASLEYLATIYHGIPVERFTPRYDSDGYLVFFGRIHPDTGAANAIEVAQRSRRRLCIAGVIQDEAYFAQIIAPHIDGDQICFLGAMGSRARDSLLGGAAALLHLVHGDGSFDLSVLEAMACGTPVIAMNRGSASEIIRHGETGWLVPSIDAAIAALPAALHLDRRHIRTYVEDTFNQHAMVEHYLRLYTHILDTARSSR